MSYLPVCNITIGSFRMRSVHQVVIKRSIFQVGSTAVIKIPLSAYLRNASGEVEPIKTNEKFKVGDKVSINLGYDPDLYNEFNGFVSRINPQMPLEIECEDWTWPLRRINIKKSWKKATLSDILQHIADLAGFKLLSGLPDVSITNFMANDKTALWVLQELKSKYGMTIYFSLTGYLYAGLAYTHNLGAVKLVSGKNIVKSNDLKWVNADDVKLKIKAISMERNGSRIEAELGDTDGEIRTLYFYDVHDKEELKRLASSEIEKYKYNGYRGSVNCLLKPFVQPAMSVELSDLNFEDRSGKYYVESTEVAFGTGGGKRKIDLGIKLN
ncbi:MAG: hypothetical protein RBS07_07805 [Lentimicrobium sp.]|nr:hypothetical protein [Lentimicrobium sp.]